MFSNYPDVMSVGDLQSALGIGRTKAYELVNSGLFPVIRVGKSIRIPKKSLLDYVNRPVYNDLRADSCP